MTVYINVEDFQSIYKEVKKIAEQLVTEGQPRGKILSDLTDLLKSTGDLLKTDRIMDVHGNLRYIYTKAGKIKERLFRHGFSDEQVENYLSGLLNLTAAEVKKEYW